MAKRVIHLATTKRCTACRIMKTILQDTISDTDIELKVVDFADLPEFIKTSVKLTDFPTVIFLKDGIIKYQFVGTKPKSEILKIMKDIRF